MAESFLLQDDTLRNAIVWGLTGIRMQQAFDEALRGVQPDVSPTVPIQTILPVRTRVDDRTIGPVQDASETVIQGTISAALGRSR